MDEHCNRCGEPKDDLLPLYRYGESGIDTEHVCSGCCTRVELKLAQRRTDDHELVAFTLALSDAVDRLHLAYCVRQGLDLNASSDG